MLNTEEREQKTSTSVCDIIILDKYFKSFLHMRCQMVCALWFFGRIMQYFFRKRIFYVHKYTLTQQSTLHVTCNDIV